MCLYSMYIDNIEWYYFYTDILNRDKEIFVAKKTALNTL